MYKSVNDSVYSFIYYCLFLSRVVLNTYFYNESLSDYQCLFYFVMNIIMHQYYWFCIFLLTLLINLYILFLVFLIIYTNIPDICILVQSFKKTRKSKHKKHKSKAYKGRTKQKKVPYQNDNESRDSDILHEIDNDLINILDYIPIFNNTFSENNWDN